MRRVSSLVLLSGLIAALTGHGLAQEASEAEAHPEAAEEPEAMNLAAFLKAAEERYPALDVHDARIRAAQARLEEARFSPFFRGWEATAGLTIAPRAEGTVIFSDQGQLPISNGWAPVVDLGVRAFIPLYTFGKLRNLKRAARAGIRAEELNRERRLARLRYDVRRAYYGVQLALDIEQMLNEGRPRLRRARRKLARMIEEGDPNANPLHRYRLEAAVAEVEARASETTRLRASTEAALRALTGVDEVRVPDCPIVAVDVETLPLERFQERAARSRPEVGLLDAAIAARRANLDIQRAGYAPDFGLGLQARYSWGPGVTDQENPWIADPANRQSLGAGLVMRWNLDFVGSRFRTVRARAQLEETEAQVEEAQLGMSLEVELAYEALRDAQRQEEAWREGRDQTRAWFVSAAQAYDINLDDSDPKDLIDALKAYFEARFNHLRSIQALNTAAAELERVSGEPLLPADGWEPSCE
ncbi:MAG: TolC family protein [Myxococcota bacterium]